MAALIFLASLGKAVCGEFPEMPLTEKEKIALYERARLAPGARQMGLGCALFANVPLLTVASGVNIADGSVTSREYVSRIYGLRKGDFRFTSAFDREMFFRLFHIPSKRVDVYYREAERGELLADAAEIVNRDLTAALDKGCFVSLRVLGDFGGPHNVLLLAHRAEKYYHHEPRTGRIVESTSAGLASRILTVSKARSKLKKRYFSSYHLVALPAPAGANTGIRTPADFPKELAVALTLEQENRIAANLARADEAEGVAALFPEIDFAAKGGKSLIDPDLNEAELYGVYSIAKLAINCHHSGSRDSLPVWLIDGAPFALAGYAEGDGVRLTFTDGKIRSTMDLAEALGRFKKSGSYFGYMVLPQG